MKVFFRQIFLFLPLILLALLLCGCAAPQSEPTTLTLSYYESGEATETKELSVVDGELSFTPPTREGYTFDGLYDAAEDGVQIVDAEGRLMFEITADMTLWAQWSPEKYTFAFDAAEGAFVSATDATRTFTYGTRIDGLPLPVRDGYDFVGWYCGTQAVSDAQGMPLADMRDFTFASYERAADGKVHLRAAWERRRVTVTFDYNDGSYQSQSINIYYGETLSLSDLPVLDTGAKSTKGWARMTGSSTLVNENITSLTDDITLYAVWHHYKDITLVEYDSTKRIVRLFDDAPMDMPILTRHGYTFDGWYASTSFAGNPTERLTYDTAGGIYYARWDLLVYRVIYDGNGATSGSIEEDILRSVENQRALTKNGFSKTGYTFLGWSTSADGTGRHFSDRETVGYTDEATDGTLTLYARWAANTYTVTLNTNYATDRGEPYSMLYPSVSATVYTATYDRGYTLPVPSTDTEFYRFIGYFTQPEGGEQVTGNDGVALHTYGKTSDITLYAHWKKIVTDYEYIATAGDLKKLNGSSGKFMLICDITDIGSIGMISSFSGILEGNGKTLSGWRYTQSSVGILGLIGTNNGTIRNLNIRGFSMTNNDPDVTGVLYAGLLCGKNNGTLERVVMTKSSMDIDVASFNHNADSTIYAGFLCGYNTGTIRQSGVYGGCTMNAYVGTKYQHAEAYCGGVAGYCDGGTLTDVFSSGGTVCAETKANVKRGAFNIETGHGAPRVRVGGIVGYTKNASVTRALGHDNALTAKATRDCNCDTNIDWRQGSLIGFRESATLSACYSESSDTLFGWASDTSGAAKLSTTSVTVSALPSAFRDNGWEDADGVPRIVVR